MDHDLIAEYEALLQESMASVTKKEELLRELAVSLSGVMKEKQQQEQRLKVYSRRVGGRRGD